MEGVSAGRAVEVTPPAPKDNGGIGKTYSPEKIGGKSLTSGVDGGIIKAGLRIDPQFFSNKNIPKMSTLQLEKSIKSWQAEIKEHKGKISGSKSFYPN